MAKQQLITILGLLLLSLSACDVLNTETPGALVPPTADEDPALPQLRVHVAGHERVLHLRTFGEPDRPVLLVLPGGPGADFRLLLPLQALADRYYVVMWDQRGVGLSERVPKEELTLGHANEEIAAVHVAVAPGREVTLVGHSHGAMLALRYAATYPDKVAQLALIEPGGITPRGRRNYYGGEVNFTAGEDFFWQNEILTSSDHAAADYKAVALLPEPFRCCILRNAAGAGARCAPHPGAAGHGSAAGRIATVSRWGWPWSLPWSCRWATSTTSARRTVPWASAWAAG